MSTTDYSSSNPFRRKVSGPTTNTPTPLPPPLSTTLSNHVGFQQTDGLPPVNTETGEEAPKKIVKRVRVQSPPPLSPDAPNSASTLGDENYNSFSNHPPPTFQKDDSFDTKYPALDTNDDFKKRSQAPANPFSRTLETLEHRGREDDPVLSPTTATVPVKGTMDVDAFKRMLMTGNPGLANSPAPAIVPAQNTLGLGDNSSSTDTSSISRHSTFDTAQEVHSESRRTSHEISEPEDDRKIGGADLTSSFSARKKPPPPSSRHGKLIKVELRDEPTTVIVHSPNTPSTNADADTAQTYFTSPTRSTTDLNKPLPPAPRRSSHESEQESVFDRESAGKVPDPPSPSSSIRHKKTPPAPPLARRHSQLVSESKLTRNDSGRLSPKPEEDSSSIRSFDIGGGGVSRSNSTRAPPPPPSRRPASLRNAGLTSPTSVPAPPPARGSSRSISGRPPSITGIESTPSSTPTPTQSKRTSMIPPPPPPSRHGRTSMDGASPSNSQRPSGEYFRRSGEIARRGSAASALSHVESNVASGERHGTEPEMPPRPQQVKDIDGSEKETWRESEQGKEDSEREKHDVLADLDALQREIDALRVNST